MEQARKLGDADVGADLRSHHGGEKGDLLGMVQHLLAVTGPETQNAEVAYDLRMQTLEADLENRSLPLLFDPLQDLLAGLGHDLFDACRVDATVDDELVQRARSHFATDGVEPADDHRLGCVIHDEVDTGRLLEGTNVAALFADDPALELVCRQGKHRDRDLRGLVRRDPLYRLRDDLASPALALLTGGKLCVADLARDLVAQLLLDFRHQNAGGFLAGHLRDPLELELLQALVVFELSFQLVESLLLVAELPLPAGEVLVLMVEVLLFLEKTLFDLL